LFEDSAALSRDPARPATEAEDTSSSRPSLSGPVLSVPLATVQQRLGLLAQQINRLQRTVRTTIENELSDWTGQNYGSLAANQDVAKMIHQMIDSHGLRIRCPECGHPAILRCSARPGVPEGVFVFDHSIEGRRTFHGGGATLPAMRVVAKPARRRSGGETS
jgi:hypothetical protein